MQLQNSNPATVNRLRARVDPRAIAANSLNLSLASFDRWRWRNVAGDASTAARIQCWPARTPRLAETSVHPTLTSYRTGPLCFEEHTPSYTHTGGH
jgi:hypothetical protein